MIMESLQLKIMYLFYSTIWLAVLDATTSDTQPGRNGKL